MDLDEPVPVQVWNFVIGALQGDLGNDFVSALPVTTLLGSALPHTIILAVASLGLAVLLGSAARRLRGDAAELARSTASPASSRSR